VARSHNHFAVEINDEFYVAAELHVTGDNAIYSANFRKKFDSN